MNLKPQTHRAVMEDELDAKVKSLFDLATSLAKEMRPDPDAPPTVETPDISEQLEIALRESLEDEIVSVSAMQGSGIDQNEVQREVVKKALVGLKLTTLKRIARREGTAASGNLEDVATRIAKKYQWDRSAVARLILANEDEPQAARGHVSRLYPMVGEVDLAVAKQRLSGVIERYIRIGIARWFLFNECHARNESMEVVGTYKTYQASVEAVADEAGLNATAHDALVRLTIDGSDTLHVRDAAAIPAKAAVRAFETITGYEAKWYLPLADKTAKGVAGSLHPTSEFLLNLVYNRIIGSSLDDINLTVARFNVRRQTEPGQEVTVGERRPELKAVRFEGEHLLDSVAACRLLTVERRPLVEIAFIALATSADGQTKGRFPVRITTESDHVAVQTGLGTEEHELSMHVHQVVTEAVSSSFLGTSDEDTARMEDLIERMKERAASDDEPEVADILR